MSNKLPTIKWKMGRLRERATEGYCSPLVWWVRETEAKQKIRELKNQKNADLYTIEEIAEYISGWATGSSFDSVRRIGKHVLLNSLSQLKCDQDGIAAVTKRKNKLK
jgi:hypothetical protein